MEKNSEDKMELVSREQIILNEQKLLEAFKNKDLNTLDQLLHDKIIFILPNGISVNKAGVMENYRSGNSIMDSITASEQIINLIDDTAVVSVIIELKGKYFEQVIGGKFRYIRVWKLFDGILKAIAVSGIELK